MFTYQLAVVLVGRDHVYVVTCRRTFLRKGADNVVGFVTLDLQNRDAHRFEHPFDVGHRNQNVFGRFRTVGLVLRKNRAPETASFGVERHTQQVGSFAFEDVAQELDEPEDDRRVHARTVAHGAPHESIIIFENQRIGVDQK